MTLTQATDGVANAQVELQTLRQQLVEHRLYESVQTARSLRLFMQEHVFAVWDFMSLLKRLQQLVTCCEVPWRPATDASLCRFINEIVLGEECDEDGRGGYASHFELYLQAMTEVGADTGAIEEFTSALRAGVPLEAALDAAAILPSTRDFVRSTLKLACDGSPHEVAAAFFYGREDVIPDMFRRLVASLPQQGVRVERLAHYLNRHIELDANDHGPLAERLVDSLCQGHPARIDDVIATARQSIRQRLDLWNGVLTAIQQQSE